MIVTDTQGRAWRLGVTDVAIGAAGVEVLADLRGDVDAHGNELVVTQVAVGDELAAAGDLVKGKLAAVPVAVARGVQVAAGRPTPSGARSLIRHRDEDLFRLGTDLAVEQGRREAVLLRRTVRTFTGEPVDDAVLARCADIALTAPAPHHTRPVRFVLVREHRQALLEAMQAAWEADLADDGWAPDRIARRTARGQVLREATEIIVPLITGDGRHEYPDAAQAGRRTHHVHRGRRRGRAGAAGRAGRRGPWLGLDLLDYLLPRGGAVGPATAGRLGTAGGGRGRAPVRAAGPSLTRHGRTGAPVRTSPGCRPPCSAAGRRPDLGQSALREAFLGFLDARPDATKRSCVPGHITASAVVLSADLSQTLLTLHPRVKRWVQLGGHCEKGTDSIAAAALREATEESGIDGLVIDPSPVHLDVHPVTCSLGVPTRHFDVSSG